MGDLESPSGPSRALARERSQNPRGACAPNSALKGNAVVGAYSAAVTEERVHQATGLDLPRMRRGILGTKPASGGLGAQGHVLIIHLGTELRVTDWLQKGHFGMGRMLAI